MVSSHGGVDQRGRGGAASRGQAGDAVRLRKPGDARQPARPGRAEQPVRGGRGGPAGRVRAAGAAAPGGGHRGFRHRVRAHRDRGRPVPLPGHGSDQARAVAPVRGGRELAMDRQPAQGRRGPNGPDCPDLAGYRGSGGGGHRGAGRPARRDSAARAAPGHRARDGGHRPAPAAPGRARGRRGGPQHHRRDGGLPARSRIPGRGRHTWRSVGPAGRGRHRRAVLVQDLPEAARSGAAWRAARGDGPARRP